MAVDPIYVSARAVLLDALQALGEQVDGVVVVGAQAIYLRTGDLQLRTAAYTTDADFALAPLKLLNEPHLDVALRAAEFYQGSDPGIWFKRVEVGGVSRAIEVDLMVPSGFASREGRRAARIPPHDRNTARKVDGLEAALVDHDRIIIPSLDGDGRGFAVRVAGPAALLVAKAFKIIDRLSDAAEARILNKDAEDVFRLMLAMSIADVEQRLIGLLTHEVAGPPCRQGLTWLGELFGVRAGRGIAMAALSLEGDTPIERIADVCIPFAKSLAELVDGPPSAPSRRT
ncbi:MAG TPA: GSU2403 family nucleotidyltransferase fold protein [Acidimicrobiales bacterium]|nr:GSU2403 family nucleotidyltransferase fold protein [Acidimicrobiales bacterium]